MIVKRQLHNNFFLQKTKVREITTPRASFLRELLKNKDVLHVGCTDYPKLDVNSNLHIQLFNSCRKLDGLDLDLDGIEQLKKYVDGNFFSKIEDIKDEYDVILIPEVIEHVDNICSFLQSFNYIKAKYVIITGPCFFGHLYSGFFDYKSEIKGKNSGLIEKETDFIEEIHPDHNCWYTPYTLCNIINKYTDWNLKDCFMIEQKTMVGVICERNFND